MESVFTSDLEASFRLLLSGGGFAHDSPEVSADHSLVRQAKSSPTNAPTSNSVQRTKCHLDPAEMASRSENMSSSNRSSEEALDPQVPVYNSYWSLPGHWNPGSVSGMTDAIDKNSFFE